MTSTLTPLVDLAGRRAAYATNPLEAPNGFLRNERFAANMRSQLVDKGGKQMLQLDGTASVVETWYDMWDMWGQYAEKIGKGAFDKTLAAAPDVAFLLNHTGMTMARTTNKTLQLFTDQAGNLASTAWLNPQRGDCADLGIAVDDGNIDQMSFAFRIVDWSWNDDYDEFTINEVDLDRGDVSAVNYGANPYTSISARAHQAFDAIAHLSGPALLAARSRLDARFAELAAADAPATEEQLAAPTGMSLEFARAQLQLQD